MHYENLIGATLILLILSLITEKAANLIKLHSKRLSIPRQSLFFEASRARDVQKRTIIIGIVIAVLCKASLFTLFKADTTFFWSESDLKLFSGNAEKEDWLFFAATLFGAVLTGLFLSLGSKFFHDLLDLLLEAKNLKRKLSQRQRWSFDTIAEADSYIQTNDAVVAKAKIRDVLRNISGISHYSIDYTKKLVFLTVEKTAPKQLVADGIPGLAPFKLVIAKEGAKEIETLSHKAGPGTEVANAMAYNNALKGTAGLVVQDTESGERYILTCYHAVWTNQLKMSWSGFSNEFPCEIKSPLNAKRLGKLHLGIKNYKLDVALIKPDVLWELHNAMPESRSVRGVRSLNSADVEGGTRLSMISRNNPGKYNYGVCSEIDCTASVRYPDGVKRSLEKLYRVESLQKLPFSVKGDSGSLVLDEFNYAIGILVAGDEETTSFVIPLPTILDTYNLKLFV